MLEFGNRVAIVSGAGRGVGRAHALMLASRGCRVVVNDLAGSGGAKGPAHDVVAEITAAGGTAIVNEDSVVDAPERIVEAAVNAFGQLDILINNAGTTAHGVFEDLSQEQWWGQVDIHLRGGVELCRAGWPHLKRASAGRIVNTISSAVIGTPGTTNYAAGKAGMLGFSRALGYEGEQFGINVNCIFPNAFTRMQEDLAEALKPTMAANYQPEKIAAFVAWLVHQDCTIRNEMFEVGGGLVGRLTFAHYPFVQVESSDPEAWSRKQDAIFGQPELRPLTSVLSILEREFEILAPDFKLERILAAH